MKSTRYFKTDCKFLLIYKVSIWYLALLLCIHFFFSLEVSSETLLAAMRDS